MSASAPTCNRSVLRNIARFSAFVVGATYGQLRFNYLRNKNISAREEHEKEVIKNARKAGREEYIKEQEFLRNPPKMTGVPTEHDQWVEKWFELIGDDSFSGSDDMITPPQA
eukprot:TRINITY_DN346_c0_g1_i1.p1 TRINITY_DN346_c0_g1~~TRINITY_DN346_c0_g1_i1.p1  ORF type:complete len:112 (+),score=26.20 TRINITY_DN346_c0_g1_i1:43-378(+)